MKKVILLLSVFLCLGANDKLKKECDKGNAESCYQLGEFYDKKGGAVTTKEGQKYQPLATEYYTKACDLGLKKGCEITGDRIFMAGFMYAQAKNREAEGILKLGCNKYDSSMACALLGDLFRNGDIVNKNIVEAEFYLKKACDLNNGAGCTFLSILYDVEKQDPFKAFEYNKRGCELQDSVSCALLGFAYISGRGVLQDTDQALHYLVKSCDMKNAKGCNGVGMVLQRLNKGEDAKKYFKKSCELKYQQGCDNYASMNF